MIDCLKHRVLKEYYKNAAENFATHEEEGTTTGSFTLRSDFTLVEGTQDTPMRYDPDNKGYIHVSYLKDAIKFVNIYTALSEYLIFGGDKGSGEVKIGLTYEHPETKKSVFITIISWVGKDSYEFLKFVLGCSYFQFIGESAGFKNFIDLFQHIFNTKVEKIKLDENGNSRQIEKVNQ